MTKDRASTQRDLAINLRTEQTNIMKFNTEKLCSQGRKTPGTCKGRKPNGLMILAQPKGSWGYCGCQINVNQHCTHVTNKANDLIKISMASRLRGYFPTPVSSDQATLAVLQPLLGRRVRSRWMWRKWRQSSLWDGQGSGHMACERG